MKYSLKVFGILMAIIIGLGIGIWLVFNHLFFSMARLPMGELISEVESPTKVYTMRAYVSKSGATVQDAIRGEVTFHDKNNKMKNIYWDYRESEVDVYWVDDQVVSINGTKLDVRKDVFDFRKEPD